MRISTDVHLHNYPTPKIDFKLGGLSNEDYEYFTLVIGDCCLYLSREQADILGDSITQWFLAEEIAQTITVDTVSQTVLTN